MNRLHRVASKLARLLARQSHPRARAVLKDMGLDAKAVGAITVRAAVPNDEDRLRQLALVDDRPRPRGDLLVAEVDGMVVAARAIDGDEVTADPLVRIDDVLELLRTRTEELRRRRFGQPRARPSAARPVIWPW